MSGVSERTAATAGGELRVWEKGAGADICFFAGLPGLPRWLPVLDRLAETRRVAAPSLPGAPGGHPADALDEHVDWLLAARDAHRAAEAEGGALVGASSGGALAADVAAAWPGAVGRLVLIAPFGVFDEAEPMADVFAQRPADRSPLLSNRPDALDAYIASGSDDAGETMEWDITMQRATNAAARLLWPLGDTRLARRLGRIACPTLLLRGADDRVMPRSCAARMAEAIAGPATSARSTAPATWPSSTAPTRWRRPSWRSWPRGRAGPAPGPRTVIQDFSVTFNSGAGYSIPFDRNFQTLPTSVGRLRLGRYKNNDLLTFRHL